MFSGDMKDQKNRLIVLNHDFLDLLENQIIDLTHMSVEIDYVKDPIHGDWDDIETISSDTKAIVAVRIYYEKAKRVRPSDI